MNRQVFKRNTVTNLGAFVHWRFFHMNKILFTHRHSQGRFHCQGDKGRRDWELSGSFFKGVEVNNVVWLLMGEGMIVAAGKSMWWGPGL